MTTMSQMQMIQSLGEAMAWFRREVDWGVAPGELRHLSGRIGELYVAMITNGRMALDTNQKGYDVVSSDGERISVKTTTMQSSAGHVSFNVNTLSEVDRVIILRIDAAEDEIRILCDKPIAEAKKLMVPASKGSMDLALSKIASKPKLHTDAQAVNSEVFENYVVREVESGSIEVIKDGQPCAIAKPELRTIAHRLSIPVLNANGNAFNTRELGNLIIKQLKGLPQSS